MRLPLYQVDAFTSRVFAGNPAAVCPLREWLPDAVLQAIAAENNLSETAFFVGREGEYALRWFTPLSEVDLCGHATLATGHVILRHLEPGLRELRFSSQGGPLVVRPDGDRLSLDFPTRPPERCDPIPGLAEALGASPLETWTSRDVLAVLGSEAEVRALKPDMARLSALERFGFGVTAPGETVDFVSRFFAPNLGVPEDPVTGSSHCTLIPYWAERLGRSRLHALQVSLRGGELFCELRGPRVSIAGHAVTYLEGTIEVDARA
jgi:PhzF family phenazine biosynthesis protein